MSSFSSTIEEFWCIEEEDRGSKVFSFVGKWTVRMTNDRRIVCRNLINTELEVEIETYTLGF